MEEKILQQLGLTRNESKVYVILMKTGSATAGEVTQKSGIHRRNVYDCMERLMEKGLVSFVIVNNRKYFRAEEPERFLSLIEEKEAQLKEQRKFAEQIMPRLRPVAPTTKQDVRFYKGAEGLKTVYEDILQTGKDYVGYGPGEQLEKILKGYLKYYINKRVRKKIKLKLIYTMSSRGKDFVKNPLLEARYLPEQYSSHAALRIYGNKVAIMLLSEEEPIAIVIENKNIAEGYRKYFDVIWNAAQK